MSLSLNNLTLSGKQVATFMVDNQRFAFLVQDVQEVLKPQKLMSVPVTKDEIAGLLNLRGQVLPALDLGRMLGLTPSYSEQAMNVVVSLGEDQASFLVEDVGDVMFFENSKIENPPSSLHPLLKSKVTNVLRSDDDIFLLLSLKVLLDFEGFIDAK